MKMIKNIIEYLIAIAVIPAIVLAVVHVTELKDVKNVQYELLSEEKGIYNITPGTYEKLVENKRIKNYDIESNYPLITQEEMDRATWKVNDDLKNEIYIDENGEKRIRENVGQFELDSNLQWFIGRSSGGWYVDGETLPFYIYYNDLPLTNVNYSGGTLNSLNSEYFDNTIRLIYNDIEGFSFTPNDFAVLRINKNRLVTPDVNGLRQYLEQLATSGDPLTVTYELAVKNPKSKVIENSDLFITSDYVRMVKPNDFSNDPNGLLISNLMDYVDRFEITTDWIYVYPKDITAAAELGSQLVGKTLTYELAQPRPVEVYEFSKFRLVFHKNRIRVVFDIDDGYYLWEITNDDKMIPINGQYDLGNVWTVKFYVYEIQQPMIRTLVLLIPLIVISGLLLYLFNMIKKKGISY